MNTTPRVNGRGTYQQQKKENQRAFYAHKIRDKNFVRSELKKTCSF